MRCRLISMLLFVVSLFVWKEGDKKCMKRKRKGMRFSFSAKSAIKTFVKNESVVSYTPVANLIWERQPIFSLFFCDRMHVLPEVIDDIFSLSRSISSIHFLFLFMGINEQRKGTNGDVHRVKIWVTLNDN